MKGFIRTAVVAALLCVAAPGLALGQAPFSSMRFDVSVGADVSTGRLQDHWKIGPTPAVLTRIPFHIGEVEIGAAGARNEFRGGTDGDYWSVLVHAGWGEGVNVGGVLRLHGSALVGSYFMIFDTQPVGYARRENELALGGSADLSVLALEPVILFARTGYLRVFTSTPIDLIHLSAGLAVRIETPNWLRTLLR